MGIIVQGDYETPQGLILSNVYVSFHNSVILYDKSINKLVYTYNIYKDRDSAESGKRPLDSAEVSLSVSTVTDIFAVSYENLKTLFPTFVVSDDI